MARITDGAERVLLEDMLDRNRVGVIEAVEGLSEGEARVRLVVSETTPIGLIKHVAAAERFWFQRFWSGLGESECDGCASPGAGSFAAAEGETLANVVAEFERASARSRRIVAGVGLDDTKPNSRGEAVSLRWILLHMIEELARHAGHGDILREQIVAARETAGGARMV